jgi:N-acyl-D-aspartate/D-glutamate deacylase
VYQNYAGGDLEDIRQMLVHPQTILGIGDAGAHCGAICDGGWPTFLLTHWARDRSRGPQLPLGLLVQKQTRDTAWTFGICDRGVLAPGYRADVNVIDIDRLGLLAPEAAYDLPLGGRRLLQRARGYRHTFCAGVEVTINDAPTGALPGKLLRGAQPAPVEAASSDTVATLPAIVAAGAAGRLSRM